MKTIRLTMGQALVKFLDNQYVEFDGALNKFVQGIFTVFGHGNVVGFGEALEGYKGDMVVYQGKNEQGMAHAAIGYAKQKNRREIIACTSSIGPGALNMVTAAGTATVNRIPLLLFPGDTFACRQPDPVLQQVENPLSISITANDAFKPVSRYWDRVVRPEQLMSAMLNAMRVLTDPAETGAVTICLPQDTEAEAYDYPVEFFEKRVHHISRRLPTRGEIERAAVQTKNKKKPIIICGGGVVYSEAGAELVKFAEKFNIPFGETQAGKGAAPWNHKLNLGGIGVTGGLAANRIAADADLVIAVGTRLSDFTTSSKWLFKNSDVEVLSINSELVTSIQEGKKINILLFDNSGFGCIENLQNNQGIPSFTTGFKFRDANTGRLTGDGVPISYAECARGYGARTYTARTVEELRKALESARKDTVSTLIDIKVIPKTMTDGYESWWRVGVPEVSDKETVCEAHKKLVKEIESTKKF